MAKTNFDNYLAEQLEDPAFRERFEQASDRWDVALQIAKHRRRVGLSQKELADSVGTTQQQISRLESPTYRGSLRMLDRVAERLGLEVEVRFVASGKRKSAAHGSRKSRS